MGLGSIVDGFELVDKKGEGLEVEISEVHLDGLVAEDVAVSETQRREDSRDTDAEVAQNSMKRRTFFLSCWSQVSLESFLPPRRSCLHFGRVHTVSLLRRVLAIRLRDSKRI